MSTIVKAHIADGCNGRKTLITYERFDADPIGEKPQYRHFVYVREYREESATYQIKDIHERACVQYAEMTYAQQIAKHGIDLDANVPFMRGFERVGYAMEHAGAYYDADQFAPSEGGSIAVIVNGRAIGEIYVTGEGETWLHITGEAA